MPNVDILATHGNFFNQILSSYDFPSGANLKRSLMAIFEVTGESECRSGELLFHLLLFNGVLIRYEDATQIAVVLESSSSRRSIKVALKAAA